MKPKFTYFTGFLWGELVGKNRVSVKFFLSSRKENWIKVKLVEIIPIVTIIIIWFILYELPTMRLFGWHPPHLVDNTDTLYLGD